jgi:iron complex transport system permease protein
MPGPAIAALPPGGRERRALLLLVVAALASLAIGGAAGSVTLAPGQWLAGIVELAHGEHASLAATLLELRLSRALTGFVTGAMLSLAGVMMQALLRNPLADPYVLGISGGASVGALLALLLAAGAWVVDAAAFGGALAAAFLLYLFAWRDLRIGVDASATVLILTGVIVAAGCGAMVTLMLSLAPDAALRGMVFWMIGDLSGSQNRWLSWLLLVGALAWSMRAAPAMNVAALYAGNAAALGVPVARLRQGLFLCAALLTACAVANAGAIGFVGLVVPHACRYALGPDHRLLLPAAALAGGAFLTFADTLARIIVAPQQLPVGVVTALIGVPAFLAQLHRVRGR